MKNSASLLIARIIANAAKFNCPVTKEYLDSKYTVLGLRKVHAKTCEAKNALEICEAIWPVTKPISRDNCIPYGLGNSDFN